jgi:hypothetical protein
MGCMSCSLHGVTSQSHFLTLTAVSGCCNTLSVSETDSVCIIRVWVTEIELVSETLVCVNRLIQVSARDDPAEFYVVVCSQQWTRDLRVSRLYCKTIRGGIQNFPDWCRHLYSSCGSEKHWWKVGLPCLVSHCAKLHIPGHGQFSHTFVWSHVRDLWRFS